MESTVNTVHSGTKNLYTLFEQQAALQPDLATDAWGLAQKVRERSDTVFNLISRTKDYLINTTGGRDTSRDNRLVKEDDRETANNYLLNDESIGGNDGARKIKESLIAYREFLVSIAEDQTVTFATSTDDLIAEINQEFDFSDVRQEGKTMTWEDATFSELPLAGIIPFLTDLQSRIRRVEARTVEALFSGIGTETIKFDGVVPIVIPTNGTFITQTGTYEADIIAAGYNKSNPTIQVDELQLDKKDKLTVLNGKGKVSISNLGGVGEKVYTGTMILPNEPDKPMDFSFKFTVAPDMCVISPTKMNVLYKGVDNPIEVSVPGVAPTDLIVTCPGATIKGSNGSYTVDVTKFPNPKATIAVSVKTKDGKTKPAGSLEFRVYKLPEANGTVNTIFPSGSYSKSTVASFKIGAKYKDFVYELPLSLTEFEVKISGKPAITCKGTYSSPAQLTAAAKTAIENAPRNSIVAFRKMRAMTAKGGIVEVADFVIEVK
jgi:gliding motility-associated protein GldM